MRSVRHLQTELQLARIELAENLAERGIVHDSSHQVEVRMVHRVEELGSELQLRFLPEPDVPRDHEIRIHESRPDQGISANVAEGSGGGQ